MGNRIHPEKTFEAKLEQIFLVQHEHTNSSIRRWKAMKGGAPPACDLKILEDFLKEKLQGKKLRYWRVYTLFNRNRTLFFGLTIFSIRNVHGEMVDSGTFRSNSKFSLRNIAGDVPARSVKIWLDAMNPDSSEHNESLIPTEFDMSTAIPCEEIGICVKLMLVFYGIEDIISRQNYKKSIEISQLVDLTSKPQDMVGCSFVTIPGLADKHGSIVDISSQVLQATVEINSGDLQIIQDQNSSYVIKLVEEISSFLDGIVASEYLFAEHEARIHQLNAMSKFMLGELRRMDKSNDDKQDSEPVVPSQCEELPPPNPLFTKKTNVKKDVREETF
uniref:Uncharacterized protein n=1 Tax=Acrobeloides nanus TaxID=290746 RepID=A0A914CEY8_9BILA